jgi:hypothetical protein
MERLEAEDAKKGRRRKPLTDEQKARIRALRDEARAKLAELEILHRDKLAELQANAERAAELTELEERYETDRRRVESKLESEISRIKGE